MAKGSSFEREQSKAWSEWWSNGTADDVFWRSNNSGARATVRAAKGQSLAGQHGDMCAMQPDGLPLINLITFEFKKGYSTQNPQNLVDRTEAAAITDLETFFSKAHRSSKKAGTFAWMVIQHRNYRQRWVWFPKRLLTELQNVDAFTAMPRPNMTIAACVRPITTAKVTIPPPVWVTVVGMLLSSFWACVDRHHIEEVLELNPLKE